MADKSEIGKGSGLFFGGMPTRPDVELILEAIPPEKMNPGDVYGHEDIAAAANLTWRSNRYNTVISAWRRHLSDKHNIRTGPERGIGVRVLFPHERVAVGIDGFKKSRRRIAKAAVLIDSADRDELDEATKVKADHAVRLMTAHVVAMRQDEKKIASAGRVVALPRKGQG